MQSPKSPLNCEGNLIYLERAAKRTLVELGEGKILIVIARSGKNESKKNLNTRRLHNVRVSLVDNLKIPAQYIVFAKGEPTNEFGQIEFYLSGRMIGGLRIPHNKDICADCCDIDNRYYPYKINRKSKSK